MEITKIDYYNLREMLVRIYDCVSAWDNDEAGMAKANKETPEDMLAEYLEAAVDKYRNALIWCSGSDDFQMGGKAREGWEKICLPLLQKFCITKIQ